MEKGEGSVAEADETHNTTHHLVTPPGLTQAEFDELKRLVTDFHTYTLGPGQCSSLLAQRINAPLHAVWSLVRRFDHPQTYKHFIKSCTVKENFRMTIGCTRDVNVISGLPADTSTERLDMLDEDQHVTGFSIIGGEHRLRNYRSVTSVHGFHHDGKIWTVVLESYIVDVPEGNTEEDTRLFADTVVKLNLQKLASVAEAMARDGDGGTVVLKRWGLKGKGASLKLKAVEFLGKRKNATDRISGRVEGRIPFSA
ncbi:abscisic acid receptor PYR1-like isoform X1 [Carya illinoinensis]|nr:abscisic acid receptor PYR1-like isoform X1 [Carya illinoinensis]